MKGDDDLDITPTAKKKTKAKPTEAEKVEPKHVPQFPPEIIRRAKEIEERQEQQRRQMQEELEAWRKAHPEEVARQTAMAEAQAENERRTRDFEKEMAEQRRKAREIEGL